MNKNYYDILWVLKTSTDEDIKKSYRKLAMKYHPDRNKWNSDTETKFKEINEAYWVIWDKEKRKQYDTFWTWFSWFNWSSGNPFAWWQSHSYSSSDFSWMEDIFSGFSKWKARKTSSTTFDFTDLFSWWFSAWNRWQSEDFDTSYSKRQETKEIEIDIEKTYEVPIFDLILGCSIEVEWNNRKKVKLKIPANTKPGTKFRVKDLWKTINWKTWNLLVKIEARMPKNISDIDMSLLERIRENIGY